MVVGRNRVDLAFDEGVEIKVHRVLYDILHAMFAELLKNHDYGEQREGGVRPPRNLSIILRQVLLLIYLTYI